MGASQQVSIALAALSAHHLAKVVLKVGTILLLKDELLFAASKVHQDRTVFRLALISYPLCRHIILYI